MTNGKRIGCLAHLMKRPVGFWAASHRNLARIKQPMLNVKYAIISLRVTLFLILAGFGLTACSTINVGLSGEEEDFATISETRDLISALGVQNSRLKNFKGIGTIKVSNQGKVQIDERVAWIGSQPLKISIAVLISGHPAVKLSSDGEWFYYLESQGDQSYYKKIQTTNANLKRLISIPIRSNDVITLLTGRVPIREYHQAQLKQDEPGDGYVLILRKRWWGIIEKIYVDENKSQVRLIEMFNRDGSLAYRASFEKFKDIKGYRVPFRLKISNDDGADCRLDIDRYWADIAVSPSMFVLTPPEQH